MPSKPPSPTSTALIKERPDNPYFHELKGDFYKRAGRHREAIVSLRQALKLAGDANLIRVELAQALLATNEPAVVEEASNLLRRSLVEDQNSSAYRALGDAQYRQNKQPEAEASLAQAAYPRGRSEAGQELCSAGQAGLDAGLSVSAQDGRHHRLQATRGIACPVHPAHISSQTRPSARPTNQGSVHP